MKNKEYKDLLKELFNKFKEFDFNSLVEKTKNIKIEDIQNLNYRKIFYDLRSSKFFKPILGISGASLLTILVLVPEIKNVTKSFIKIDQYKMESKNLNSKINELKLENIKFKEISSLMTKVNQSFLPKDQIIFLTRLLNDAAKKTNVNINSFSPILQANTSNLCKTSLSQKNSKKFKKRRKKSQSTKKGSIQSNFFEINFNSNYMDIVEFLKEIQLYDVVIIPYCLEVDSETKNSAQKDNKIDSYDSIIIQLNKSGNPIESKKDVILENNSANSGNVTTRIVIKIPSFIK